MCLYDAYKYWLFFVVLFLSWFFVCVYVMLIIIVFIDSKQHYTHNSWISCNFTLCIIFGYFVLCFSMFHMLQLPTGPSNCSSGTAKTAEVQDPYQETRGLLCRDGQDRSADAEGEKMTGRPGFIESTLSSTPWEEDVPVNSVSLTSWGHGHLCYCSKAWSQ